jgi:DNA-binding NarL/FixJ family response regulator
MAKKQSILIVDDNTNFINRMVEILAELEPSNNISIANNFEEAQRSIAQEQPDIILLDINMPGKSGIELLREIKSNQIPCEVIMMTNHTDPSYRTQCNELGADFFLDKTNDFGLIPEIVSSKLES